MGLRLKFLSILVVSFLAALAASSVVFYKVSKATALERLHAQITVLRAQALAVRSYTSDEIKPLLSDMSNVQFLPQTVPSFSAQSTFAKFRDQFPDFYYKEAALNPTNPSDMATTWEADMINLLRKDRTQTEVVSIRDGDKGRQYTVAFPLAIKAESCLSCHSTPNKAPASMTALYGDKNGFGWHLNDVIGAQIFSVPIEATEKQIWSNLYLLIGCMSVIFLALLLIITALLHWMVVRPVIAMSDIAERVSMGDSSQPEYTLNGSDEIASLSRSFNRMRRSLDNALKMLETS
jgi:methyl-accepting chemotaxis protein